jgi:ryanodine receptor 2
MLRADELYNEVTQDVASKGASQGMFIGCFIDTATGWISFTCEGKETKHRYKACYFCIRFSPATYFKNVILYLQMEVGTKLFPAIFVEATSKEVLQFELGRTPTTLPLSAAVLQNSEKHVVPQVRPSTNLFFLGMKIIILFGYSSHLD